MVFCCSNTLGKERFMGSSLEEDYFSSIRKLLNPGPIDPWKHSYKLSVETRLCAMCKESKPTTNFYIKPNGRYLSVCRPCQSKQRIMHRAKRKAAMGNTGDRQTDSVHSKSVKPKKPKQWANESLGVPDGARSRKSVWDGKRLSWDQYNARHRQADT